VGNRIYWMSEPVLVLFDRTYGMSFPPSPTQFAVPSLALIPAVIPKGGMSEASTEPEELEETPAEEESTEEEASDEEAVEGKPVPGVAAGAAEVIVMKVLGRSPPPPPPWCL
jgi:hypothetical protein